jgi:hypothetical protein
MEMREVEEIRGLAIGFPVIYREKPGKFLLFYVSITSYTKK